MKNKNYFWGIVFILAAMSILLGNFDFFPDINLFKIFVSLLLLYLIIQNIPSRNFYGILIPIALLCIIYDDILHIQMLSPFPILAAAVLASIGLTFIFPGQTPFKKKPEFGDGANGTWQDTPDESEVTCSISFAGATKYVNTSDFRQAYLKCTFGSLKTYFDHARITGSSAEIYVENAFGETTLFIPKEWNVTVTATTTFGDIDEIHKLPSPAAGAPSVSVQGNISFGDLKIYYI